MPTPPQDVALQIIDLSLEQWRRLRAASAYDDCSDQPETDVTRVATTLSATIDSLAPMQSHYANAAKGLLASAGVGNAYVIPHLAGILHSLRDAYAGGYLVTIAELVRAETFAEFIGMAEYLLAQGYKDAAAVIGGAVLEQHLRDLAVKFNIGLDVGGKAKAASALNAELGGKAYSKLDLKSITAWQDLRNKAAHGNYGGYSAAQVEIFLAGIRDFVARTPA